MVGVAQLGRALRCGRSGWEFKSPRSPIFMLGFLNRRISTHIGIIVILFFAFVAGWFMINQYIRFMEMRIEAVKIDLQK